MKVLTQTLLLVLLALAGKSQQREFIIKDIFPTQTSTAIHSHFILPFKMDYKIERKKFPINYRPSYIYHLTPRVEAYKKNEVKMSIGYVYQSDSSIVRLLLSDGFIRVNQENLFYDDDNLVTFKSGVFVGQEYHFILQVKHNQSKETFNIKQFDWFVEIAKSWRLVHGNHH